MNDTQNTRNFDFAIYSLDGTTKLYKATTLHHISQWAQENGAADHSLAYPNKNGGQSFARLAKFVEIGTKALRNLAE